MIQLRWFSMALYSKQAVHAQNPSNKKYEGVIAVYCTQLIAVLAAKDGTNSY